MGSMFEQGWVHSVTAANSYRYLESKAPHNCYVPFAAGLTTVDLLASAARS